jgi:RNA polymerase sigma-70 factor (ECF subfamily)
MEQKELVKRFLENRDSIMAFIVALTRDFDVAEEVFQDVAVAVLVESSRADDVRNFLGWVREIARHRVADHYRRQTRQLVQERLSDELVEVICRSFEENETSAAAAQSRMKFLLECIGRLAGRSRELIEGFYRDQKSLKKLAADTGWKENSVKVALSRARKVLADCVEMKLRAGEAN